MINDIIIILFFTALSFTASYFLDYCLGSPGADEVEKISPKEIFFRWTYFLATRRLKRCGFEEKEVNIPGVIDGFKTDDDEQGCIQKALSEKQIKQEVVSRGRELFTWEFAAGMCIYCTNFWISIFICLFYIFILPITFIAFPNYFILCIPFFSHFILRKL